MADPLSITVGAIGITTAAITSIIQLKDFIDGLQDAPAALAAINSDLSNIKPSLDTLESINIPNATISEDAKVALRKTGVADAVKSCSAACDDFRKKLARWTKHSNGNMDWRDRLRIGTWERAEILRFSSQVETCKMTVTLAVNSTSLLVLNNIAQKTSEAAEKRAELQATMLEMEKRISENVELTKQQQADAQKRRQDLERRLDEDEDDDDDEQSKLNSALGEVDKQSAVLERHLEDCGVIFSQLHSGRTGVVIGDVKTDKFSQAMLALPESVIGRINARIGNVSTTDHSSTFIGVYKGDFAPGDFFKNPPRPSPQTSGQTCG